MRPSRWADSSARVRAFMAGAMKKAGCAVESFKPQGGERTYRINGSWALPIRPPGSSRGRAFLLPSFLRPSLRRRPGLVDSTGSAVNQNGVGLKSICRARYSDYKLSGTLVSAVTAQTCGKWPILRGSVYLRDGEVAYAVAWVQPDATSGASFSLSPLRGARFVGLKRSETVRGQNGDGSWTGGLVESKIGRAVGRFTGDFR